MARAILLLSGMLGCRLASPPAVAAQAPGDARVVPIQVTGDPAKRFSLVILGDGYTAKEQSRFREHVDRHLNILWSLEPFRTYRNYINVYAVEIISAESGITCDPAHREMRSTALGLRFGGGCENPNARGIWVDPEAARRYARLATTDFDQILTIANTDTYGGIGGTTATTSGGNALGPFITPHELGHSLGRLQDEYTYSERGVKGGVYTGDEPNSIHHTIMSEAAMRSRDAKWYRWLGEPSEAGGVIGLYEGGQSRVAGIWRPSRHSMMISLGYYLDQVSRERLTERISRQVELITAATPTESAVSASSILWIETVHPNFHDLVVTWQVDGRPVDAATNHHALDLRTLNLAGAHTVRVKVVDPTAFVRDPMIRDTSFTAMREWSVRDRIAAPTTSPEPAITASTDTSRPVAGSEVVFVQTTHPAAMIPTVAWQLDGRTVIPPDNPLSLPLATQNLQPGRHRLRATSGGSGANATREWTIDDTGPTVTYTLSTPVATIERDDGSRQYFVRDHFTMKLEPTDDQPGWVEAEFRVNGDGWHHYYGWPDAPPGTPFLFTARGTKIKELIYGSLSAEGLSPQPWEPREPGWGTHSIEYRARDAAGNIGEAKQFFVTVMPEPECTTTVFDTRAGDLSVGSGTTCIDGARIDGSVTVSEGARVVATNATIRGSLAAEGASSVELVGTTILGGLHIAGTTGSLTLFGTSVDGDVVLENNRTPSPLIAGNRFGTISGARGPGGWSARRPPRIIPP
jgi:IgA Peptidase M64